MDDIKEDEKNSAADLTAQEKLRNKGLGALEYATRHRFILLMAILGAAISFALIRTETYLDIGRNQARYDQETSQIRYKKIDEEKLQAFEQKQQDKEIEVSSQFDPNRDNPFTD